MTKHICKNVILFAGLILAIVAFHVFSLNLLERYVSALCRQGEEMIALVSEEKYAEAFEKAEEIEKQWEENGRRLCFFIDHDDVETIGHMLAKVQSNFREETWALAVTEMEEIMAKAQDMYKRETLTLENIF